MSQMKVAPEPHTILSNYQNNHATGTAMRPLLHNG